MQVGYLKSFFALAALVIAAGCAGAGHLRYDSPKEAVEKGKESFEKGKYTKAIEYFQGAFDFGRTHEYAADAQFYLARAYRANKEYLLAANEYSRFIQIYRSDQRVPVAEFERAMTYFERSPAFDLDQTDTEEALKNFQLFLKRYPSHPLVADAEARIKELREKLAHKAYETGHLYERRELYRAAALAYESAFDRFPDTDWADDALLGAVRAYISYADQSIRSKQRDRLDLAVSNYKKLLQLFPDSPVLKEAEKLYGEATKRLERLQDKKASS